MTRSRRHIALIAHDTNKVDLLRWAEFNRQLLRSHTLYATGTTGTMLEHHSGVQHRHRRHDHLLAAAGRPHQPARPDFAPRAVQPLLEREPEPEACEHVATPSSHP